MDPVPTASTWVVTGANSGIGLAIVEAVLASRGEDRVVAVDREVTRLTQMEVIQPRLRVRQCDLKDRSEVEAVFHSLEEDSGLSSPHRCSDRVKIHRKFSTFLQRIENRVENVWF